MSPFYSSMYFGGLPEILCNKFPPVGSPRCAVRQSVSAEAWLRGPRTPQPHRSKFRVPWLPLLGCATEMQGGSLTSTLGMTGVSDIGYHRFLGSRHFRSFIWTCATWRCSILQHRYLPARVCMKWKLARCCPCTLFVAISDSWRHVLAFLSWKPRLLDVHSVTDVYPQTIGQYVALAHITEVYGKYDWLKLLASLMTFSLKSGRTLCCSIVVFECDMWCHVWPRDLHHVCHVPCQTAQVHSSIRRSGYR